MRIQSGTSLYIRLQNNVWQFLQLVVAIALIFTAASTHALQSQQTPAPGPKKAVPRQPATNSAKITAKKTDEPDTAWLQDALKNKELMDDLAKFAQKLKDGIHYPAVRSQSNILPRLGESTEFYVAIPNYGETIHQALDIFHQELQESAAMREFLKKNKLEANEPEVEHGIQKFYEFTQFLGDELVVAGRMNGKDPEFVLVAEARKPGIKNFLEKLNNEMFTSPSDRLRIVDSQGLAAIDKSFGKGTIVLVRDDLVVLGTSAATLREFNAQVDARGTKFITSALGQRLVKSYKDGTNTVIGVDLHQLMALIPPSPPQARIMLEKSGFGDAKYLETENTIAGGRSTSKMEMVFNGPRHGVASWLAAPAPMGGLDFVPGNSSMAIDMVLKNPTLILDDLREMMGDAAFASLPQMEAQLGVNLKQDLLSKLSGEIAFDLQQPPMPALKADTGLVVAPEFKIILRVNDPVGLQETFNRLMVVSPMQGGKREEDGVTFHTLSSPSAAGKSNEMNYFFMDGYLVITSDAETAREAVRAHRSGDSLGKSNKLRDARPAGQTENTSLVVYQDSSQMMRTMFTQISPEMRQMLPFMSLVQGSATLVYVNGEESSFQGTTSDNINANMGTGLIIAAVAIPNLTHSRTLANASAAASTMRTINTAEVTYLTTYRSKGYARSLAAMGPPANGDCSEATITAAHSCLLDKVVGNADCTSGTWCPKGAYRFSVRGVCLQTGCKNYVATATPVSKDIGTKSFCSISDAVVRVHTGAPLDTPLTAAECLAWRPLGQE
jgi:type IV pilus assembly protein PilA